MTTRSRSKKALRRRGEVSSSRVSAPSRIRRPLITLLTDFGNSDYFVGAVKGVILASNPQVRIIDITHDIPPQDIEAAAFTLLAAVPSFPPDSIHMAVVDPGVGSSRRPIAITTADGVFVGPDNGIFSYVCDRAEGQGQSPVVVHLDNPKYFNQPVSPTFNGRDLFAPVAAALSLSRKPNDIGTTISDMVRLPPLKPAVSRDGRISGRIIHIDRFGNCVTNITQEELTGKMIDQGVKLNVNGATVKSFRNYFSEAAGGDKLFGVWGSAGFLEIATRNGSAAKQLKAARGDAVLI